MYDRNKCRTCIYLAKVNEGESCCIYILVENHKRGCYGDGDCPMYEKRDKRRRPKIGRDGGIIYYDD